MSKFEVRFDRHEHHVETGVLTWEKVNSSRVSVVQEGGAGCVWSRLDVTPRKIKKAYRLADKLNEAMQ